MRIICPGRNIQAALLFLVMAVAFCHNSAFENRNQNPLFIHEGMGAHIAESMSMCVDTWAGGISTSQGNCALKCTSYVVAFLGRKRLELKSADFARRDSQSSLYWCEQVLISNGVNCCTVWSNVAGLRNELRDGSIAVAILHLKSRHFVVAFDSGRGLVVFDPESWQFVPFEFVCNQWSGYAVFVPFETNSKCQVST